MRKKYDFNFVKKTFEDAGLTLLETEYKDAATPMKYICRCGNEGKKVFYNLLRGMDTCNNCKSSKTSLSFEEVKQYYEDQGCVLLEETYTNNRTPLKYRCSCGETSEASFTSFKRGSRCKKCGLEKQGKSREGKSRKSTGRVLKHSIESAEKIFKDSGCTLLEAEYKNVETPMSYICVCGKVSTISLSNFKRGKRCRECGLKKLSKSNTKYSVEMVKEELGNRGYKLLEPDFINSTKPLFCECPNGHQYYLNFSNFKKGHICRECYLAQNWGENHHSYKPELTPEEREGKRLVPGYHEWVNSVYKRDNYTCQCCLKRGGINLNAHHILNYSEHLELRTELSNGITLCSDCHMDFHNEYGRVHNTRKQLNIFLEKYKNRAV